MSLTDGSAVPPVGLVGRERVHEQLRHLLRDAAKDRGGALVLSGPPGIGKTALVNWAVEQAEASGCDVRAVTGVPVEADLPYGALRTLLVAECGDGDLTQHAPALVAAVGRRPLPDPPAVREPLPTVAARGRVRRHSAVRRSLGARVPRDRRGVGSGEPAYRGQVGRARIESVQLRRGLASDAGEMADLWLRARAAAVPHIPAPVHSDDEVRSWFSTVVVPEREAWVADDNGLLVALLVLEGDWVDQPYVDPTRTNSGIGQTLLELAKELRPAGLRLWTFAANHGARRFYERHGFIATASTEGENEEGAPDVRYEWTPSALPKVTLLSPGP